MKATIPAAAVLVALAVSTGFSQRAPDSRSAGIAQEATESSQEVPTWTDDVAPIMAESCMNCHRPGQVAPMTFLSYEEVRPWARSIKMMVEQRIMPPWHADGTYPREEHEFGNDRRLTDEEIETIAAWVDAGTPRGEGDFEPPRFARAEDGFLLTGELGPPDFVFEMEDGYEVPAGGSDINIDIAVPTNLERDIWVQAAEVRGNFNVVHHNVVSIIGPDGEYARTGRLASTVPGKQWDRFPEGSGKLIEAGSTLRFGLHYHPSNRPVKDTSRVGVWLVRDTITHELHSSVVADPDLKIPPYEPDYESRGEFTFETDAGITLFKPHMHYRGNDMLYRVLRPGGGVDTLLSVPNYDMNWQISYEFAEPVPVKEGTVLEVIAHFDNSAQNPWNPDPSVQVLWGGDSRDEMMEGWFDYQVELEEPIVPENQLRPVAQRNR